MLVTFRGMEGNQTHVRWTFLGHDHEQAARDAFKGVGRTREVIALETFDGPPRRWDPSYEVTEL